MRHAASWSDGAVFPCAVPAPRFMQPIEARATPSLCRMDTHGHIAARRGRRAATSGCLIMPSFEAVHREPGNRVGLNGPAHAFQAPGRALRPSRTASTNSRDTFRSEGTAAGRAAHTARQIACCGRAHCREGPDTFAGCSPIGRSAKDLSGSAPLPAHNQLNVTREHAL